MSLDLSKLPSLESIIKVVELVAIGYLIFSVLSIFNVSSKNIDEIKKSQQMIMDSEKHIIENHNRARVTADSLDKARIQQIQALTDKIGSLQTQLTTVQTDLRNYKSVFDKNKIDLPNPWQK